MTHILKISFLIAFIFPMRGHCQADLREKLVLSEQMKESKRMEVLESINFWLEINNFWDIYNDDDYKNKYFNVKSWLWGFNTTENCNYITFEMKEDSDEFTNAMKKQLEKHKDCIKAIFIHVDIKLNANEKNIMLKEIIRIKN